MKQIKNEDSVKKRRLAHVAIMKNCGCRKDCSTLLSRDDKQKINQLYWNMDANEQRNFIQQYVNLTTVKHRRKTRNTSNDLTKNRSYICTLPDANDVPFIVCRTFFLNTIGFS